MINSLITSLKPQKGIGIDISEEMINIAKNKYKKTDIKFMVGVAENIKLNEKFDYIFLSDVIEHLSNVEESIKTNIIGTLNVTKACLECNVDIAVFNAR